MSQNKPTIFVMEGNFLGLEMARELRDFGHRLIVIGHDKNDIALYAKGVEGHVLPLPQDDSIALLSGLKDIAQGVPGDKVLMGASEGYRQWVSHHREELSKHFHILACPTEDIDALMDKWLQLQLSVSGGIAIPQSAILDEKGRPTREVKYPAIVKPRFSKDTTGFRDSLGKKVLLVKDQQELERACHRMILLGFTPIIQEVIPGVDFSQFLFGAAVKDGKPSAICLMQKIKTDPWPYGSGVIIRTIYHKELLEAGLRIIDGTNYSGICDIEFIRNWDTGEFQFIEFNPRYGLGQRVAKQAGVSLAEVAVRLAQGDTLPEPAIAKPGFYWVYFDEWVKEMVIPWRNSAFRRLRTRDNTVRPFDFNDCRPEIRHINNIARLKFKRLLDLTAFALTGFIGEGAALGGEILDEFGKLLA